MTNTENEFEFDGKVYVAVPVDSESCEGCDANGKLCSRVYCTPKYRQDNRNVIFKEKV